MFCHLRISIAGGPPRLVVLQLRPDKCPKTCDNFVALCQSSATAKRPSASAANAAHQNEPTYRGTEFHRVLPGFMIQGGDFTKFDGSGGYAAPTTSEGKPTFPDESFDISHDREGILSMANRGKHTNGGQFFITLGKTLHLDGKHVAFGHVVRGMEVVRDIAKVETEGENGRPVMLQRVLIVDCGLGTGDEKSSGSSSNSSSASISSGERRRSKKRKKKHQRRSRGGDDSDDRYHKKEKKRAKNRSSHSKHRKRHDKKEDRKSKKRKDKSSHRRRDYSSSSEDERRHSSKKRRK